MTRLVGGELQSGRCVGQLTQRLSHVATAPFGHNDTCQHAPGPQRIAPDDENPGDPSSRKLHQSRSNWFRSCPQNNHHLFPSPSTVCSVILHHTVFSVLSPSTHYLLVNSRDHTQHHRPHLTLSTVRVTQIPFVCGVNILIGRQAAAPHPPTIPTSHHSSNGGILLAARAVPQPQPGQLVR